MSRHFGMESKTLMKTMIYIPDKNVEVLAINVEGFGHGLPASIVPKFNDESKRSMVHSTPDC